MGTHKCNYPYKKPRKKLGGPNIKKIRRRELMGDQKESWLPKSMASKKLLEPSADTTGGAATKTKRIWINTQAVKTKLAHGRRVVSWPK